MAVSCPEVMYGAYYPYLYGRGRLAHHHHHFQYDRFNVGGGGSSGGGGGGAGEAYGGGGAAALSSSSSGAQSPGSPPHAHLPPAHHPPRLRAKEEDLSAHGRASADGGGSSESEGECAGSGAAGGAAARARAQYVSANCVVFTHYSGDVATVVDEHFARALSLDKAKESVPMVSRNLPASFFNALACGGAGGAGCVPGVGGVGAGCGGGGVAGVDMYEYDPWHSHYPGYQQYHAGHMAAAAGYGGLLLPRSMHPQYKPVEWPSSAPPHHLDPAACSPYSYHHSVPGLEAQVQDSSKDLYWF